MCNYRLTIEYDGTGYNGWQIQKSKIKNQRLKIKTIQGEIEEALAKLFGRKIRLIGAGRTDAGVHAQAQVANFKIETHLTPNEIKRALNAILPRDIRIIKTEYVPWDFHSRFAVKSKLYRYQIFNRAIQSPFYEKFVWHIPYKLDIGLMKEEARVLLGRHDFRAFQGSSRQAKNTTRTVRRLKIAKVKELIQIEIEADGFLNNMVRNIVGSLVEIGRGRFPPGSMKKILYGCDRRKAGPTAPAKGLCLIRVEY